MKRDDVERRLMEVHARLVRARQELAVVEEQLEVFLETADEARIRALVSETPLADRDWHDAQRHAAGYDAQPRHRLCSGRRARA